MIKHMDKILFGCLLFAAAAATFLAVTKEHLLYVG